MISRNPIPLKQLSLLIVLAGLLTAPWACSTSSNPTTPGGTNSSNPTVTPTSPPCVNATTGFTCTPTLTFTATSTTSPTFTATPTITATPTATTFYAIHWAVCGIDNGNGTRTASLYLQVNGSPETTAGVTLVSAAAGVTVALPYSSYSATYNASVYTVGGFNYQVGATYVISSVTSAGTASATLVAPGGVTVTPDGSTASWASEGNNDTIDIYPGAVIYGPDLVSPFSIPASVYTSPVTYQVDVVVQRTGTVTGALAVNPPEISDFKTTFVCPSCPTSTPTWTFTPSFTSTNTRTPTSTFTKTSTPTSTATQTFTATSTFTSTSSPTACSTRSSFGNSLTGSSTYDESYEFGTNQYYFPGGRLQGLSANLSNSSGPGQVRLAIYTDNGGAPQSLVAQVGPVSAITGVNSIDLASPIDLTAGNYWLVFQITGANTGVQEFTGSGFFGSASFGAFPANFSGLGTYFSGTTQHYALNGTYCP